MIRKHRLQRHTFIKTALWFFTILSWLGFLYILMFVSPRVWQTMYFLPFFAVLSLAISLLSYLITRKIWISIIVTLAVISILGLRLFGFKEWWNSVLILAITITLIYFFTASEVHGTVQTDTSINKSSKD